MGPIEAIKISLTTAESITKSHLQDLSEEEMMHRPHPNSNHIKWQLGHLILSNHRMIGESGDVKFDPLPSGFIERYGRDEASCDDIRLFDSKEDLLHRFQAQLTALYRWLDELTLEELDRPSAETVRSYAPTIGAALILIPLHWMMHAGQWAVIRRQLGRPPLL